jgi:hypothetical protein
MNVDPTPNGPAKVTLTQGEPKSIEKARLLVTAKDTAETLLEDFEDVVSNGQQAVSDIVATFGSSRGKGESEEPAETEA